MNVRKQSRADCGLCQSEGSTLQLFPLLRYRYCPKRYYYACGNTPPEDLLHGCVGVKKPSILSMGCGDVRSCFYTMWKYFDQSISNAPQQFDGADFLLNDRSSAVLARNIMFILLSLQLPKKMEERKEWLGAIWAVWYCHELYPRHQRILDDCLKLLLQYSESLDVWTCADNPLHSLVFFTSAAVLTEISRVWKMWLELCVSVEQIHSSRNKLFVYQNGFSCSPYSYERFAEDNLSLNMGEAEWLVIKPPSTKLKARIPEMVSHLTSGNSYAEFVFNTDLPISPTTGNPTLYENPDEYTLSSCCVPFLSYYHTVEFSHEAMKGVDVENHVCASMLVQSESFKSHPLLANSVQQFSMWIQSSSAVLNEGERAISFTFNNQDALEVCQELQHGNLKGSQFDSIFSSNLIDYLGLPNVVLSALPLLKPEGLLFTGTMMYKFTDIVYIEDFLTMCFGFDSKLLPVILGVRCVNHEGNGFSSPVMIQPIPIEVVPQKILIWKKVSGQPMSISNLPLLEPGNVTEGLVNSFLVSTLSLMTKFTSKLSQVNDSSTSDLYKKNFARCSCIETAMLVLKTFISSVNACSEYRFYEPLSAVLIQELKPFLSGLQTQALLHDLHIHLTVDEVNCPICRQSLIEEYIGLFCAEVPLTSFPTNSKPNFVALIHPLSSLQTTNGQNLALHDKDIHVIDCIDGAVNDGSLLLKFFAPMCFAVQNFNVTIAYYLKAGISLLSTTAIKSIQVDFVHYRYFTSALRHSNSVALVHEFGELFSNVYTQENVTADVALSDSVLEGLALNSLSTNKISSSEIQLTCGALEFNLKFMYSIDCNEINMELSTARKSVEIVCPRQIHQFKDENPIFIAHPDHLLSLPPQDDLKEILSEHSDMEHVAEEAVIPWGIRIFRKSADPLFQFEVNEILANFFQHGDEFSFHLLSCDEDQRVRGQVYVNKCMFDYQHYAPAVDLAFCFFEDHSHPKSIECEKTHKNLFVSDAECDELREVLLYFAQRTNGDCKSAGVNSIYYDLVQQEVDTYFIRAVVYFLYSIPLRRTCYSGLWCSFCSKSGILKTCKLCGRGETPRREWQVGERKEPAKQPCKLM